MKKRVFAVLLGALVLSNTALANYTENLQYRFSNQRLSIEYAHTRLCEIHSIEPAKSVWQFLAKGDKKVVKWRVIETDKFNYATSNGNQYFQHDYAVGEFDQNTGDLIGVKYVNQKQALTELDTIGFGCMNNFELLRLPFKANLNFFKESVNLNNDVNIVANGNIYALNREGKDGIYKSLTQLDMKKHGKNIVCFQMVIPNAINTIILKQGNNKLTYAGREWENIDGVDYLCESYIVENLQTAQINRPYRIKLYYGNGELKYFSHIMDEGEVEAYDETYYFEKARNPEIYGSYRPSLYKVLKLSSNVDDSLFNSYKDYKLKELVTK